MIFERKTAWFSPFGPMVIPKIVRQVDTFIDHGALVFRLCNIKQKHGKLKMFPKLLNNEQLLIRWKQAILEFYLPILLGQ